MMRTTITALFLVAGCAGTNATLTPAPSHTASHEMSSPRKVAAEATPVPAQPAPATTTDARKVGDFVVFKFSGSYRKTPLTLREQVVAREGNVLSIDYSFSEGKKTTTFRVRTDHGIGGKGEVFGFARIDGATAIDATRDEFDAFMAKTVLVTDDNEETLGSTDGTHAVGDQSFAAKTTTFRVRIGKTTATMKLTQSDDFAWGADLVAEIVAKDGTVLYRAELVEAGQASL